MTGSADSTMDSGSLWALVLFNFAAISTGCPESQDVMHPLCIRASGNKGVVKCALCNVRWTRIAAVVCKLSSNALCPLPVRSSM